MMPEKLATSANAGTLCLVADNYRGIRHPACMAEANFPVGAATYLGFAGVVGTDIFDAAFLLMFCISCMLLPLERRRHL